MATKSVKTTTRKTSATKTTAPKVARARKSDADTTPTAAELMTQPVHEMIAIRAYEMWCARGHQHGHDVEDWLAAERELSTRN